MVELILEAVSPATSLYNFVEKKIKDFFKLKDEERKHLIALREEIRFNLATIERLGRNDTSWQAIYDPVQRKLLDSLRCKELVHVRDGFDRLLKGKLKKQSATKDRIVLVFYNINEAAKKLTDLNDRLGQIPRKPAAGAGRILVGRRLSALKNRLEYIDNTLKIVPLTKYETIKRNPRKKT